MDFVEIASFIPHMGSVQFIENGKFYYSFMAGMEIETTNGAEMISKILFCEKERTVEVFTGKKKVASFYNVASVVWQCENSN